MASLLEFLSQPIKRIQENQGRPFAPLRQYQNSSYQVPRQAPGRPLPQRTLPDEQMSLEAMLQEAANPNQGINPLAESIKAVMNQPQLSPYIRRPELNPEQGDVSKGIEAGARGWWRGAGGVVSDLSGLYDLLSPGEGTSEFTKTANQLNEENDQAVKDKRLPKAVYTGGQVASNVAAFTTPSTLLKTAGVLPKASKAISFGTNVAADTAQGAGFRAAREQDVSAGTLGLDAAISTATGGAIEGGGRVLKKLPGAFRAIADEVKAPDVAVNKTVLKQKTPPAVQAQNVINRIEQKAANEGRNVSTYEEVKIASALRKAGIDPASVPAPKKNPNYAPKDPSKWDRTWMTVNGVISQYGDEGKKVASKIKATRDYVETSSAQLFRKIPTVQSLDKNQFVEFVDALDAASKGKKVATSPEVKQAVKEWQGATKQILREARGAGIKMGDLGPNYFPRIYKDIHKDKVFNKIVDNILEKNPTWSREKAIEQADFIKKGSVKRYGNLEKSRTTDVAGYEKNHDAVVEYINRSFDRIGRAKEFGANDEVLTKARATLQKQGYNISKRADDSSVFSKYVGIGRGDVDKNTRGFRASAVMRKINAFTSLSAAGISNATQLVNTASVAGIGKTMKGIGKALTSPEAKDYAAKTGVDLDHAIASVVEQQVGTTGKITRNIASPFFQKIEKFNRDVTAIVGADFADKMAKKAADGDATATRIIREKLGVTGKIGKELTDAQHIQASRKLTEISQFKVDPMDLPGWVETPLGKLAAQFRTFGYKQSDFMWNQVLQEGLKNGNYAPMVRFITVGVPAGLGANEVKDFVRKDLPAMAREKATGEKVEEPEDTTPKSQQLLGDFSQGFAQVGGGGIPGSFAQTMINGFKYGNPEESAVTFAGGPTLGLATETTKNYYKGKLTGNWDPLKKEAIRKVPAVGPAAANLLMPASAPTEPSKPGAKAPDPRSPQADADAKVEKEKLQATAGDGYSLQKLANGKYAYSIEGDTELHTTSDLKTAQKAIREEAFKKSGGAYKSVGEVVLRRSPTGEVTTTTKTKYEYSIGTQELEKHKRNEDLDSWFKTADKQIASIDTQLKDPAIDPLDKISLENDRDALQKNIDKYKGYGAFTKGKGSGRGGGGSGSGKAKKASIPKLDLTTANLNKAPAIPKIAIRNRPTYKGSAGVKKLSVRKIPTTYRKKMV